MINMFYDRILDINTFHKFNFCLEYLISCVKIILFNMEHIFNLVYNK